MKHPNQPIYIDGHGVARFHKNEIVRFLLDAGPFDLNKLARMPFDRVSDQLRELIPIVFTALASVI